MSKKKWKNAVGGIKGHNTLNFPNGGSIFVSGKKYLVKARDRSGNRSGSSNAALVPLNCRV